MVIATVPKTDLADGPEKAPALWVQIPHSPPFLPGVAQSGSARALGAWGRGFESLHPGQLQGRALLILAGIGRPKKE